MREKRDHSVRTSVSQSIEPRKKYFLVYEGIETEPIYFDALKKCTEYSRISPLIDMIPIVKGITKKIGVYCRQSYRYSYSGTTRNTLTH